MTEIRVDVTLTFRVDATEWALHRDLDPASPDEVRASFLTYVRSQTLGGLPGHIALRMDELTTAHGQIRLSPATLALPPDQPQ